MPTEIESVYKSKFRDIAEGIADYIRSLGCFDGRSDITVIVEDKGVIEKEIAQSLSFAGVCILIAVMGFDRLGSSGPILRGNLKLEFRVMEHPFANREKQGSMTAQQVMELLIQNTHWRTFDGMDGRPLLFQDFSREDTDEVNVVRGNWSGEVSLGMVTTQN